MDGRLDTVIQDLQGAIGLVDRPRLIADEEAWRAHPLHVSKTDGTASPTYDRGASAFPIAAGVEIREDLDPSTQRLAP